MSANKDILDHRGKDYTQHQDHIKDPPSWLLDNLAEASKNAKKIYLVYLSFIAYCVLTVANTTDRQLILNSTTRLPIVNIDISINGFF